MKDSIFKMTKIAVDNENAYEMLTTAQENEIIN